MKKHMLIIILVIFISCTKKDTTDLSQINWIQHYQFQEDQIHTIFTTGIVPAPKVPFTIEGVTKNCILSLGTYDLILNEKYFDLHDFEPFRLSNKQIATREMLLEEGLSDSLFFLGQNFNDIRIYLMKKSEGDENFAGMLGWQFFQSHLLVIDLQNNLVGFRECDGTTVDGIDFYTGPMPSKGNNMLKFKSTLNGQPITISISTSIRHSFISPEFLNKNEIKYNSDYTKLDSLKIGNAIFQNFTCYINKDQLLLEPENKAPIDLILGLNEIKKYLLVVDFCNQKIGFVGQ